MRPYLILCAVLSLSLALPARAQRVLPPSFGNWAAAGNLNTATGMSNPEAAAFQEYGFTSGTEQAYRDGNVALDASIYTFKDPSGAYGAYSYLLTPDMKRDDVTEHSSISPSRALILVGNLVIDVHGSDLGTHQADLKSLIAAVEPHAQTGPLPNLWQHLPTKGFVERSDHYILGPQTLNQLFPVALGDGLGFSKGAEAEIGHYKLGSRDVTLLIADFPTPQLAMQQFGELQQQFNVNGSKPDSNAAPLFAKRSVTLLAIAAGAPSQAEADTLLNQVQSGTVLTWDEPTFQFKEPSIEVMVVGSITGAGLICGFALIAGLAFGGFRLFIKRLLPGRVFDRGAQLQVLQLGLSSKPINAEDFYASVGTTPGKTTVDKDLPDRIALRIFR